MKHNLKTIATSLDTIILNNNAYLLDQMYQVYNTCFDGWNKDEFKNYLLAIGNKPSVILISYDKNKIIGYNITNIRKTKIENKNVYIISADIALLPEYRGKIPNLIYIFKNSILFKIKNPFSKVVYIDIILNYKMYHNVVKTIGLMPNPKHEIPEKFKTIIYETIKTSGFDLKENGYSVFTNDKIIYTPSDKLIEDDKNLYAYFLEKTYNNSCGLVVLIPGSYFNALKGLFKLFIRKIKNNLNTLKT